MQKRIVKGRDVEDGVSNVVWGEPCVLPGTSPKRLLHGRIAPGSVRVRSTYLPFDCGVISYEEGKDYVVDYAGGLLRRTGSSAIPDYGDHIFSKRQRFDLAETEGVAEIMNDRFTIHVDYVSRVVEPEHGREPDGPFSFPGKGAEALVAFYGDSITFGHDATVTERSYPHRWAEALAAKFPDTRFRFYNRSRGGAASRWGLAELANRILPLRPDILVIGFGMNDQNGAPGAPAVAVERFAAHISTMVEQVRAAGDCSVVLVSPCVPNPRWNRASGTVESFRDALAAVSRRFSLCRLADVTGTWQRMLHRKAPEDLLRNNVNHPGDFGHRIYAEVLQAATLGTVRRTGPDRYPFSG